jgi:hypothetical protein
LQSVRRLGAGLLNLLVLSTLFVGSCAGPGIAYFQSPKWFLKEVDLTKTKSFFVAFESKSDESPRTVQVMQYKIDSEAKKYSDIQFQVSNGHHSSRQGDGSANIDAWVDAEGGQLIQVFVVGDSPWASLSEYRVMENKIFPLRHADAATELLLGALILPFLIIPLRKPIRRGINRLMRIDPK